MIKTTCTLAFACAFLLLAHAGNHEGKAGSCSQKPLFPLSVSENGRYLMDRNNIPFFYQAETPWRIFINLNEKEMDELMDIRVKQGFNVIQVMALTTDKNVNGDKPFENLDFTKPNLTYFEHIKLGIRLAESKGLLVSMNIAWKGCCGGDWSEIILENGPQNCREYGRFLGKFFAECKNIIWVQGGDNDPREHIDHYRQMALGILESNPSAIQTFHAASGHSSSDMVHYLDNSWLNFVWTYTYFKKKHKVWIYACGFGELPEVYEMNHIEYQKVPVKPFILGESQYEGEDSSAYAPLTGAEVVRRQAYWSVLSGSCGHAYGSWCWKVDENWRKVEEDQGANDMLHVKELFESVEWIKLQPDIQDTLIQEGAGIYGETDYAVTSISSDKSFALVYIPPTGIDSRTLRINLNLLAAPVSAHWYNPTNGEYMPVSEGRLPNKGYYTFITPGDNGENSNDWVLVLK